MEAMADTAVLRQFVEFARQIALPLHEILPPDLKAIVAAAKQAPLAPAHGIIDILQICAQATRRDDLGVAFADWIDIRSLGPISLMWDHCSTLEQAVSITHRYLNLENAAMGRETVRTGDEVALVHFVRTPTRYGGSQFLEATMGSTVRVARMVLGPTWTPLRVEFGHDDRGGLRFKNRFFGCPILHGHDHYAVICRHEDMVRRSGRGSPQMLAFLEQRLDALLGDWPEDFISQVEKVVTANLAGGHADLPSIARMLAVSERTLQRRLGDADLSFGALVDKVRKRRAEEYFHSERTPNLARLAYLLGYSDATSASRFLRKMDMSRRALRRKADSTRAS